MKCRVCGHKQGISYYTLPTLLFTGDAVTCVGEVYYHVEHGLCQFCRKEKEKPMLSFQFRTGETLPTISVQDIRDYLQSLDMEDYAGTPNQGPTCLSAQTLAHKYGGTFGINVGSYFFTLTGDEGTYTNEIPHTVRAITDRFDKLQSASWRHLITLTRKEVEDLFPELR